MGESMRVVTRERMKVVIKIWYEWLYPNHHFQLGLDLDPFHINRATIDGYKLTGTPQKLFR